ncbi:uncharacterized protein GIQ15_03670 [Arthroderma uncinatum]|uniref:uncharacterized protein n=1 Tax=Arthroderma uncinatum TaxID=74035 RepID=UPI00144AC543|nr:uncharacterized protein GIQ15_03670 [Arthroderma uncinatum]KAF3484346.1 hypothetical protein GIQ15_03670 [Arthroderma uncinatum]
MLEQNCVDETQETLPVIAGPQDDDTTMDGAIAPAAPAVSDNNADMITELQGQLAASVARVSALGSEVAFVNAALESKQGEFEMLAHQVQAERADLMQQFDASLAAAIEQRVAEYVHKINDLSTRERALTEEVQLLKKYQEKMQGTTVEKAVLENSVVKVMEQEALIHDLQQQLHLANQRVSLAPDERLVHENAQLRTKVQAARQTERGYVERQIRFTNQVQSLESELLRARQALSNANATKTTKTPVETAPATPDEEVALLEKRVETLKEAIKKKDKEYKTLQDFNEKLQSSIYQLGQQLQRSDSLVVGLHGAQGQGQGFAAASSTGGSTRPKPEKRCRNDAVDANDEASKKKNKGEE